MALRDEVKQLIANELLPRIRADRCVLFAGAGLSYEAGLPSAGDLAKRLWRALPEEERPKSYTLSEVAEIYLKLHSKQELVDFVREALQPIRGQVLDTTTFRLIAHIPHLNKTIITTNWDTLLEEAIQEVTGTPPVVVVTDLDMGKVAGAQRVIYKIHGSVDAPETLVVTERDYRLKYRDLFDAQSLVMANVRALLTSNVIIYTGYSLRDEYFDELLRQIRYVLTDSRTGEFMGWTSFLVTPEEPDQEALRRFRGLRMVWIDASAREFFQFVFAETAEFVNREKELQTIRLLKEPYVEIHGGAGIGKTRLLRELANKYKYTDNWPNVFYIDLREGSPLNLIRQQIEVRDIDELSQKTGLFIAMDSLDRAEDSDEVTKFIIGFHRPEIPTQRIIWATRYSVLDRLPPAMKFRASSYPLSSMLTPYVAEMVKNHVELIGGKTWKEDEYERLASEIIALTGTGHPGLVVEVLRILSEATPPFEVAYLQAKRKEVLHALRKKLRSEVFEERSTEAEERLKPVTRLIENTFCAMRGVTSGMIARLVEDGKVAMADFQDAEGIFKALLDTHLLDRGTYPLYSIDATIRYVLVLCLQEDDRQRFKEINDWCTKYFWEAVQNSKEDVQRAYVREWLFHHVMQLDAQTSPQERLDLLRDDLRQITLRSAMGERAKETLIRETTSDEELKNLLVKHLGVDLLSSLLQELTKLTVQG